MGQRIITRGLGTCQLLATRGYGRRTKIVEVRRRVRRGRRPPAHKLAVDEEECYEINVALLAINGESLDLVLTGRDKRCFDDNKQVIKAKLAAVTNPPDPVIVEAVLKAVRSYKKRRK